MGEGLLLLSMQDVICRWKGGEVTNMNFGFSFGLYPLGTWVADRLPS